MTPTAHFTQNNQSDKKDVFLSYCWMNSAQALKVGTKGREGSLGAIDPRDMKEYLEKQGISCWLDIECAGKVSSMQYCMVII